MPLADWAYVFSGPLFTNRLAPGYLAHAHGYMGDFLGRIAEKGRSGSFWTPG